MSGLGETADLVAQRILKGRTYRLVRLIERNPRVVAKGLNTCRGRRDTLFSDALLDLIRLSESGKEEDEPTRHAQTRLVVC